MQEAIAAESFYDLGPLCVENGDLEKGFAESDHLLEGEMKIGGQVNQDSVTGIEVQLSMKATWFFSLRCRRLKVKWARELKNSWHKGREPLSQWKFSIPS